MHAVTSTADTLHAESHEELGAAMWNDFGLPYDDYPNDTSEDYARMLFSDGTAYVARIDLRTWIIEHVYKGMVQVSSVLLSLMNYTCASFWTLDPDI